VPLLSLCGLGEPLLNPRAPEFTARIREAGFRVTLSTNGSLLDERRGRAMLDAGLQQIMINVGARDREYEDVYQLPFQRTRNNVLRFQEMAGDDCEVVVVLVDYHGNPDQRAEMREYWRDLGVCRIRETDLINRGGALSDDRMQFESSPEVAVAQSLFEDDVLPPMCGTPFAFLFVGYDGHYYLCSSDWKKEVSFGTVFDRSFVDLTREKLRHVAERRSICRTCNVDPINETAQALRTRGHGEVGVDVGELAVTIRSANMRLVELVEAVDPGAVAAAVVTSSSYRRHPIPVTAR
jgi:MoaA/NifB/PqqE/SkfB family radical SAM enzyme